MNNKDIPYEQQMKIILGKFDNLVEENKMLKEKLAKLPGEFRSAKNIAEQRKKKLDWIQDELTKYLVGLGIEIPPYATVTKLVKMITSSSTDTLLSSLSSYKAST